VPSGTICTASSQVLWLQGLAGYIFPKGVESESDSASDARGITGRRWSASRCLASGEWPGSSCERSSRSLVVQANSVCSGALDCAEKLGQAPRRKQLSLLQTVFCSEPVPFFHSASLAVTPSTKLGAGQEDAAGGHKQTGSLSLVMRYCT
jgi:hypothetical protein